MKSILKKKCSLLFNILFLFSCQAQNEITSLTEEKSGLEAKKEIIIGAEVFIEDLKAFQSKNLALLVNPTSVINGIHLVDVLLQKNINIVKIFAPEHGFRGQADAGESIKDGIDIKTNLPVISLYGKHKKPSNEDLNGIDYLVFDVQDVGARFYTYISTLHYIMEACAENNVSLIVLDRPNPNGHLVDGSILDTAYQSFVGMHPVPVLHGMTIGEYAKMINGENWLKDNLKCNLTVISMKNYNHLTPYSLPIKPSPNLPNDRAITLYPSTCFFEGTVISEGRGTDFPFQVFGAPEINKNLTPYFFIPKSREGAKYPKFANKTCYGFNINEVPNAFEEQNGINLNYLITMYNLYPDKEKFFLKNGFFDLLAGGAQLRKDIIAGKSANEIKASWQEELNKFKKIRKQYLLYTDFE